MVLVWLAFAVTAVSANGQPADAAQMDAAAKLEAAKLEVARLESAAKLESAKAEVARLEAEVQTKKMSEQALHGPVSNGETKTEAASPPGVEASTTPTVAAGTQTTVATGPQATVAAGAQANDITKLEAAVQAKFSSGVDVHKAEESGQKSGTDSNAGSLAEQAGSSWSIISATQACQTNKEGIAYTSAASGFTLESCKSKCSSEDRCQAIDFYSSTGWCVTYDQPCKSPLANHDGSSSYSYDRRPKANDITELEAAVQAKFSSGLDVHKADESGQKSGTDSHAGSLAKQASLEISGITTSRFTFLNSVYEKIDSSTYRSVNMQLSQVVADFKHGGSSGINGQPVYLMSNPPVYDIRFSLSNDHHRYGFLECNPITTQNSCYVTLASGQKDAQSGNTANVKEGSASVRASQASNANNEMTAKAAAISNAARGVSPAESPTQTEESAQKSEANFHAAWLAEQASAASTEVKTQAAAQPDATTSSPMPEAAAPEKTAEAVKAKPVENRAEVEGVAGPSKTNETKNVTQISANQKKKTSNHYRNHGADMYHVEPTLRQDAKPAEMEKSKDRTATLAEKRAEVEDFFHLHHSTPGASSTSDGNQNTQPVSVARKLFNFVLLIAALGSMAALAYTKYEAICGMAQEGKDKIMKSKSRQQDSWDSFSMHEKFC